jgi:hypothetical protein
MSGLSAHVSQRGVVLPDGWNSVQNGTESLTV